MKTTPITQTAKSTPFKINQSLVDGAKTVAESKGTVFEVGQEESPNNNQQPAVSKPVEETDPLSKKSGALTKDLDFASGSELFGMKAGLKKNPFEGGKSMENSFSKFL